MERFAPWGFTGIIYIRSFLETGNALVQLEYRPFCLEWQSFSPGHQVGVLPAMELKGIAGPVCDNQNRRIFRKDCVVLQQVDAGLELGATSSPYLH